MKQIYISLLVLGFWISAGVYLSPLSAQNEPEPQEDLDDSDEDEEELIIEGISEKQGDYIRSTASGVTKSDIPLMETPQSVQVVPNQVIEDQKAVSFNEAGRNVSNLSPAPGAAFGTGDALLLRGFFNNLYMIDGQPNQVANLAIGPREMRQYKRIEVLKGPSSMTFGSIEPGGAINLVTKKPLAESYNEVEVAYGSYNFAEGVVDTTGPLNEDRTLLYRLIAVGRNQDNWRNEDGRRNSRAFVAPALTWLITPDTSLTLFGHYQNDVIAVDRGIPAVFDTNTAFLRDEYNNTAPLIIRQAFPAEDLFPNRLRIEDAVYSDRFFNNQEREASEQVQGAGGYEVESDFGSWVLRHRTRGEEVTDNSSLTALRSLANDNRTLGRQFERRNVYIASYNSSLTASGKFKTGNLTHRPHLGVDFTHVFSRFRVEEFFTDAGTKDLFLTDAERSVFDNINAPNLADYFLKQNFDPAINIGTVSPLNLRIRANFNNTGVYGQYNLSIGETWHFLVGARYDQVRGKSIDDAYTLRLLASPFIPAAAESLFTIPEKSTVAADHVSPRGGIVFRPIEQVSFFVSAAENFTQDFRALTGSSNTPKPTLATSYEGGVKFELFNQNLVATLTGFEIRQTNIVIVDPLNSNRLTQTGEQTHKGGEFDVLATPVDGLNLIAGVGYLEAEITKDDTRDPTTGRKLREGKTPNNVPEWTANAWVVYEFQTGFLQGFGLGMGAQYVGERFGTLENDLVLPQYTIANGLVYYKIGGLRASVNVKNIYNERYIALGNASFENVPGRPIEVIASLQMKF